LKGLSFLSPTCDRISVWAPDENVHLIERVTQVFTAEHLPPSPDWTARASTSRQALALHGHDRAKPSGRYPLPLGVGPKNERLQKAGGSWGQFLSALPGAILNFFLLSEFSEPVHSPRHECYRAALPDMDGPSRCRHRGLCGALRGILRWLAIALSAPSEFSIAAFRSPCPACPACPACSGGLERLRGTLLASVYCRCPMSGASRYPLRVHRSNAGKVFGGTIPQIAFDQSGRRKSRVRAKLRRKHRADFCGGTFPLGAET
jgi:hypothetical protein